jgi:hypothetical protein
MPILSQVEGGLQAAVNRRGGKSLGENRIAVLLLRKFLFALNR